MCKIGFLLALLITVQVINVKNGSKGSEDNLQFSRKDSLVIFFCFISSFLFDFIFKKYLPNIYIFAVLFITAVYFLLFTIVNFNREKDIKNKHDQILKIYQACADIFGRVDSENIDYDNIPFELEKDDKTGQRANRGMCSPHFLAFSMQNHLSSRQGYSLKAYSSQSSGIRR